MKNEPQEYIFTPALSPEEKALIPSPVPLPMTPEEIQKRGWSEVDIVFVTGDAYVDHPSFAAGLLARVLEAEGYRVVILSQPDWQNCEPWKRFGRPRLGFCVSAGNMDSMINHYTANRKVRNEDAYSPNGQIGFRPDRATLAYCQRAREAYPGIPIVTGGVEASLRRFAHYDFWSDKVKRSILMDSKASLLSYGMGESSLREIYRRLDAGESVDSLRDVRGTAYRIKQSEDLPEESDTLQHLPSFEEVCGDRTDPVEDRKSKKLFAEMTKTIYENLNPYNAKVLVQEHGLEAIAVNPPSLPLSTEEMDRIYALPFTRKPHPSYGNAVIPALDVVKDSVTILRGCFGGCAFCSITAHQGKIIQSRSEESVVSELKELTKSDTWRGTVSDLGGPTANMYRLGCSSEEMKKSCRRSSCLHPSVCPNLNTDHSALLSLYRRAREIPGIKNIFIASGVRTDLALESPEYIDELVRYHIGGHLKTAPEHTDPVVLNLMRKTPIGVYEEFCDLFAASARRQGKEIYLVPYLIAGLPGCDYKSMVEVAVYLKKNGIRPKQVQDFIPTPFEAAGAMYYTGLDLETGKPIHVPRGMRERRLQHALLMYYNPEYYHDVKSALKEAGREDLIGTDADSLIPPHLSKAEHMRQSSRVKRLMRNQQAEREAKAKVRQEYREQEEAKRRKEEQKRRKRSGRPRAKGPHRNEISGHGEGSHRRENYRRGKDSRYVDGNRSSEDSRYGDDNRRNKPDFKRGGSGNRRGDSSRGRRVSRSDEDGSGRPRSGGGGKPYGKSSRSFRPGGSGGYRSSAKRFGRGS
jgi:uncharacterized radical SAM protein YgiQ